MFESFENMQLFISNVYKNDGQFPSQQCERAKQNEARINPKTKNC